MNGSEHFQFQGNPLKSTVIDFWRWSSSDLLDNRMRGVLAEFVVATALECVSGGRVEWDAYDIVTPQGKKIEVKSAAYIQTWEQAKPSVIRFDIAPKMGWDARTNEWAAAPVRAADVYVFCLLAHQDSATIDPLNLDQWQFYVLPTTLLDAACGGQKSIGLASLERVGAVQCSFGELQKYVISAA